MTTIHAKTIEIFLPDGDPKGIRIAEITTRIVQVIQVPRVMLKDFIAMPQSEQVAVYFLVGVSEDEAQPKVYVGQSSGLRARLVKHNKLKDFWQHALVLISRTDSLTETHAKFLEWYCLQATRNAGRYADDNGNAGSKPYTTASLQAACIEIFETGQTLLTTLGFPLFDRVVEPVVEIQSDDQFVCTSGGVKANMLYTKEGFVVLKGSVGKKPSSASSLAQRLSEKLIRSGVMRLDGDTVIFVRDYLFESPSTAAVAITGRNTNGWREWKHKDGRTLHEVKRQ